DCNPSSVAEMTHDGLVGRVAGAGQIKATCGHLQAEAAFVVQPSAALDAHVLSVEPAKADLAVHETLRLDIAAGGKQPITIKSSDPKIVVAQDCDSLVGQSAGRAEVVVGQGDQQRTIQV